jgi:hypothetical protein
MFYRVRVYARYWRQKVYNFNTDVLNTPWGGVLERCLTLGVVAWCLLAMPFHVAQRLFEHVVWVAIQYAMVGWLVLIPLALLYTAVVKFWIGRRYVHHS